MGHLVIDNNYLPQALALIETAKKSVDISTFKGEYTIKPRGEKLRKFFDEIVKKAQQGVKVRLLINWHSDRRSVAKTNLYVMQLLKQKNIWVKFLKNNRCCHAKILLVDNEQALIGSHNLSVRSCFNNFEISYVIPDPESVAQIKKVYDHSFQDGQDF